MRIIPFREFWKSFVELLYCNVCIHCGRLLNESESHLCLHCLSELALIRNNATAKKQIESVFWGRIPVKEVAAYMRFVKGGISQAMLHDLKYHDNKKIGIWMGELFGLELKTDPRFASIDCIIPVPLHPSKMRLRGYNQSELIAKGMARQLQVPVDTQTLVRKIARDTQTHKTRIERWLNVDGNFCVRNSYTEPIHVLLVDDVLTTGATIEACAQVLLQIPGLTLSIACIAKA